MIRGAISIAGRRSGTIGGSNFFAAASTATGRRPISATAFSAISARTSPTLQSSVGLDSDDEGEAMRPNNCHGSLTKIVATIGPTSEQLPVLQELVHAGINVMRLNFSHATVEEVELRTTNLKACKGRHAPASELPCYGGPTPEDGPDNNVRAILLDTRGPEIRTGKLANDHSGHEIVTFEAGATVTLHTDEVWADKGSTNADLYVNYANLHKSVVPGMKVLLDDGAIILTVTAVESNKDYHGTVTCAVENTGELRSRAGVNLPGADTDLPAMSEKDKIDIKYGMTKDVDFVAASFIQNAESVRDIRKYMQDCARELGWHASQPLPLIISKIESTTGVRNFDEILEESDGIMVARGDLGVEIPIQTVTNAQKEMVAACNAAGKPVIVATQMLESMAKNPRPTRAEVADVTNAVYDGADAVMLSGETAKGRYPVDTVKMMSNIIKSAEKFENRRDDLVIPHIGKWKATDNQAEITLAKSAVTAAQERDAKAILVLTSRGTLPRFVSAYRPAIPIISFCPNGKVAKQLMLNRGVHPVIGLNGVSMPKRPIRAIRHAVEMGFVKEGDDVVVATMEADEDMGTIATLKVATVPEGVLSDS